MKLIVVLALLLDARSVYFNLMELSMKQLLTGIRMGMCTLAVLAAGVAHAQSMPAPAHPAYGAQNVPQHEAMPKQHRDGKAKSQHKEMTHEQKARHMEMQEKKRAGSMATGHQGKDMRHGQLNEYERNALRRCEIFKTDDDRRACVARVRDPQISGGVREGGQMRESTMPVPAHGAGAAMPSKHK